MNDDLTAQTGDAKGRVSTSFSQYKNSRFDTETAVFAEIPAYYFTLVLLTNTTVLGSTVISPRRWATAGVMLS